MGILKIKSKQSKPISVSEYLKLKKLPNDNNIYTSFKALKMAKEEGIEVYDEIPAETGALKNVTLGQKVKKPYGNVFLFNSMDISLDFDKLAQQLSGKDDISWDNLLKEMKDKEEAHNREQELQAPIKKAALEENYAKTLEALSSYCPKGVLDEYKKPTELGAILLSDAIKLIEACEKGESPRTAIENLKLERPAMLMTLILRVYSRGPELYETYVKESGLEIKDLNPKIQHEVSKIQKRNKKLMNSFNQTLDNTTSDSEFETYATNQPSLAQTLSKSPKAPGEE